MGVTQSGSFPMDLPARLMIGITDAQHMAGRALVKRVSDGMRSGKSGRVYGGHQASAPGEYSAIKSGQQLGSINYAVAGLDYIRFYANAPHAGYQEFGTSKMAARENLARAIRESDGEIVNILNLCVLRVLGF